MTEQLEKLAAEVRKLTPAELDDLRSWLAGYHPESASPARDQNAPVDWSDLLDRVKAVRGGAPPLSENIVLTLRQEERY